LSSLKKGTVYLTAAWGVQLIAGYGINTWLAKSLDPAIYGTYGVVMSILLWFEIGAISGIPTAVQKFTAAAEKSSTHLLKIAGFIQLIFITIFFIAGLFFAPIIGRVLHDEALTALLKIALWDIWVYGFLFVLMSFQNGLHNFNRHAVILVVYAVTKMVGVIFLVKLTGTLDGAFYANILASAAGLLLSVYYLFFSDLQNKTEKIDWQPLFTFALSLVGFSLVVNLFLNIDLWLVKYFIGNEAPGYYTAAATLARVPYYAFFGLSSIVLPGLAKYLAEGNQEKAAQTARYALRVMFIVVIPICALSLSTGRELLTAFFGHKYSPGGDAFRILICGMSFLALLFLFTTIINAANRPNLSLMLTLAGVGLDVVFNFILIPRFGIIGAAAGTTISLMIINVFAFLVVKKIFGSLLNMKSLLKIMLASSIVFLISSFVHVEGIAVLFFMGGLFLLYCLLLLVFGEVSKKEIMEII